MKRPNLQWILLALAVAALAGVLLLNQARIAAQANRPMPSQVEKVLIADVTVIHVETASYKARLTAHGAAEPRFELALTAHVAGAVKSLSAGFETGRRVKAGEALLELEDSDYRAAVAEAAQAVASAELDYLQEQQQGEQARHDWKSSGLTGEPASALVLREPHLAAAGAAVTRAAAILAAATKDLNHTVIVAPFDALVVSRSVSPGSYVQTGSQLATLYSTDRVEIAVSLSAAAWRNLPEAASLQAGDWPVTLVSVDNETHWTGRVLRDAQHLDGATRQRTLVLAVDRPLDQDPPLLPGTFVEAQLEGRLVDGLWKLPASARSQQGEVWYVTANGTLRSFAATPIFSDRTHVYIAPPEALRDVPGKVVIHPLNSYVQGMMVRPVEVASAT